MASTFVREVFADLVGVGFKLVPETLATQLRDVFATPTTALAENGFRSQRVVESHHQEKKT
eukprot:5228599-Alexandrium_andersonii.AAC.1